VPSCITPSLLLRIAYVELCELNQVGEQSRFERLVPVHRDREANHSAEIDVDVTVHVHAQRCHKDPLHCNDIEILFEVFAL
jgi:hypothetical protein